MKTLLSVKTLRIPSLGSIACSSLIEFPHGVREQRAREVPAPILSDKGADEGDLAAHLTRESRTELRMCAHWPGTTAACCVSYVDRVRLGRFKWWTCG